RARTGFAPAALRTIARDVTSYNASIGTERNVTALAQPASASSRVWTPSAAVARGTSFTRSGRVIATTTTSGTTCATVKVARKTTVVGGDNHVHVATSICGQTSMYPSLRRPWDRSARPNPHARMSAMTPSEYASGLSMNAGIARSTWAL